MDVNVLGSEIALESCAHSSLQGPTLRNDFENPKRSAIHADLLMFAESVARIEMR